MEYSFRAGHGAGLPARAELLRHTLPNGPKRRLGRCHRAEFPHLRPARPLRVKETGKGWKDKFHHTAAKRNVAILHDCKILARLKDLHARNSAPTCDSRQHILNRAVQPDAAERCAERTSLNRFTIREQSLASTLSSNAPVRHINCRHVLGLSDHSRDGLRSLRRKPTWLTKCDH